MEVKKNNLVPKIGNYKGIIKKKRKLLIFTNKISWISHKQINKRYLK